MFLRIIPLILIFATLLGTACSRHSSDLHPKLAEESLPHAVNINTSPPEELRKIPHIGESLARKIIQHREANGPFRRVEHLMLIQGISDKRFRKIRPLVRVE